jgi:mRNA interferase YafQ
VRSIKPTKRFARDLRRMQRRGKALEKLQRIVDALATEEPLPHNARPHLLAGDWRGKMDCHVEGDWVLIYELVDDDLILHATGTHQDLFKGY